MENLTINGRYRILQQIGVGGFGLTYLAEDLGLQTRPRCVVKHLRPQLNDAEALNLANRLFQQEAEILYRLGGHPHIPSLIAHFKERGEFYLVQEFIEGQTLDREFTAGRRYNQKDIVQFLGQTLEILSFVHSQKVIHRDIKPANLIRRNSDGSIFLIDFGAVKQVNAIPRSEGNATFSTITIGSHGYMPMEQMAGNPNFSSDLYALGLVAIQALTGIKPLDLPKHGTTNEFVWSHKSQLSPDLERFITKLVRLDFRQRFLSAGEALAALNQIAANIGFFQNRPQVSSVAVLQPIVNNQNHQPPPLPVNAPSFVPPTIIVPTENHSPNYLPRSFQNNHGISPKSSSGKFVALGIVGILIFVGFLFVAGKVLNFRWSRYDPMDREARQNSRQNETTTTNNSDISLYDEALKQAEEAQKKEKTATTKFEWEEIANKYKRAFALLTTIDQASPNYGQAQAKIKEFQEKAELADARALNPQNPAANTNPSAAKDTTLPASYPETVSPNKQVREKLVMPPKLAAQHYISYVADNGYEVSKRSITSENSGFTSNLEKQSYDEKDSRVVVIKAGGVRLSFKPPEFTPRLKTGSYTAVQLKAYQKVMNYSISFDPFSCYQNASHSFTINDIAYDDLYQNVSYLDATFELNCENRKLIGRVHYDAR
jgi:serine/threonine protein kinase